MKNIALALALLAPAASADYLKAAAYTGSSTCDSNALMISASVIDCETNGATSYKLQCANTTSAVILTYLTSDCSGAAAATTDYPVDFGCTDAGGGASSSFVCDAGEFNAPSPAGNTYAYNGVSSCPPVDGDLTTVLTYPCGTCIDYSSGIFGMYSCDSSSLDLNYYSDSSCTGAATYSFPMETMGCTASATQVTVTECDTSKAAKAMPTPALPAELKAAVAARAAALAKYDEALAKTKTALADVLA